jgi:hypothetical protein
MKLPRRKFLHLAAGAAALPAGSRFAWAQTCPAPPVRLVVGFAPGAARTPLCRASRLSVDAAKITSGCRPINCAA